MTTGNESKKAKTPKPSKLEVSKETLRDLTESDRGSAEVKGGKGGRRPGTEAFREQITDGASCDAGCE
jgi:hypothetical protein